MTSNQLREIHDKPILVTGAAGLIGSAIMDGLSRQGVHRIIACDRLSGEKWKNLAQMKFTDYIEASDLLSWMKDGTIDRKLPSIGYVFHMGAPSATNIVDPIELYQWHLDFSRRIHYWCTNRGIRLVYASSAATFGDNAVDQPDEVGLLPGLLPTSMYGWFKHRFDMYVKDTGFGDTAGLRFFNIFGANEHHKKQQSLVFRAVREIRETGKLGVFSGGDEPLYRDFFPAEDAADAAIYIARYGYRGMVSVGSGKAATWGELAGIIVRRLNHGPEVIKEIPFPDTMGAGYQKRTRADVSVLRKIGWSHRKTLEESISDCLGHRLLDKRLGEIEEK
jgi:ADP-L-glycero-D-manno-heptose 6-epimerase